MKFSIPSIRLVAALVLCAGCATLSAAEDTDDRLQSHFQAARQAQDNGDLDRAVNEYLEVLQLQPSLAEAHANLGLVYQMQSKFAESARAFEKALSLKPGLRGANLFLGIDYARLNDPVRAIPRLKQAVIQEPSNKEALTWLSGSLWSAGQGPAAIDTLQKAARILPRDSDVLFLLGEAYQKSATQQLETIASTALGTPQYHQMFAEIYAAQQAWEKAAKHYQRAIEKDARWAGAHFGLGEIAWRQGRLEEAQAEYRKELQVDAESVPARARLAECDMLAGNVESGLHALDAAVRAAPGQAAYTFDLPRAPYLDAEAPVSLSVRKAYAAILPALETAPAGAARSLALSSAYARVGEEEKSRKHWADFERATTRQAAQPLAGHAAARRSFEKRDYRAVLAQAQSILASHPHDLAARYLLGRAYHSLSLVVLERMLAADPDSYRAHQLLARTYDQREDNDRAMAEYRIVESQRPDLPGVHFSMGQVLRRKGESDQAMAEFALELRLNPSHAESSAEIGTILASQHEPQKAIPYLETALRNKPELTMARQELGKAYYLNKEYAKAERELKAALTADDDGTAHYTLGMVYRQLGRDQEARAALNEARRIQSERLAGKDNTAEPVR
jgi:tetratricopeptide (TPR) repeat protein